MKAGIEIHQRLDTGKLFCRCSSDMRGETAGGITRKLRVVSGEMGLTDQAAMYEYLRDRKFIYKSYHDDACLLEMDEEPPRDIDRDALDICLQVAKHLKCDIPEEIHIMRKTVIDGSNTSGFQRTGIIGLNGEIETSFGSVSIESVSLEEESSQILDRRDGIVIYGLNRLGIPLIEIATGPDMSTPEQVREVAESIGTILRSTERVKRGLGTIRQDVNVSVEGGTRIEIKGVQDLKQMAETVRLEAERQESLLKIKNDLLERDVSFTEAADVTDHFKNTKNVMVRNGLEAGKRVYAFGLMGFGGVLKRRVSGDRTFGKELSEYAKSQGVRGMLHTDEDISRYDLTREFAAVSSKLGAGSEDAVCLIMSDSETAGSACRAVIGRARAALEGVPKETRAPNEDGTSSFMRPLPGGDRMYPETDVPTVEVTEDYLESIPAIEMMSEKRAKLRDLGLQDSDIDVLLKSDRLPVIRKHITRENAGRIAVTLLSVVKSLKRDGVDVESMSDEDFSSLLERIDEIPNEALESVIKDIVYEGMSADRAIESHGSVSLGEAESVISRIVESNADTVREKGARAFQVLMGEAMKELRGKCPGETIAEILKRELQKAS